MSEIETIRELYKHHDWAGERVIALTRQLDDAALDRPFDMGPGSLRKTLWHNGICHWLWMSRIEGNSPRQVPASDNPQTLDALDAFMRDSLRQRVRILHALTPDSLWRDVSFTNIAGEAYVRRLGDILIHVANHAQHHHAQASNMLRHLGAKPPRLDYLFMIHETKPPEPPKLSTAILKDYFAYTDWGREMMLDLAEELDDSALDREFELGFGSIRMNLQHTLDAENFWLRNWIDGPGAAFPKSEERASIARLREESTATAKRRNGILGACGDDDLLRPVQGRPTPDRLISFPLGVTMLQLCNHGTHHRAQTINMLRHCGKLAPPTDYTIWKKELESQVATS